MVEITKKNGEKLYGIIQWIGNENKLGPMAGVELVSFSVQVYTCGINMFYVTLGFVSCF